MPDPAKIWEAAPCPDIGRPSKFTCTTTIHGKSREPLLPFVNLHNLFDRLRPRIWYIDISPLLKAQDVACLGARYLGLMSLTKGSSLSIRTPGFFLRDSLRGLERSAHGGPFPFI